eukprot:g747.t1
MKRTAQQDAALVDRATRRHRKRRGAQDDGKTRRNSYSEYERRGSLERRSSLHKSLQEAARARNGEEESKRTNKQRRTSFTGLDPYNPAKTRRLSASGMIVEGANKARSGFKALKRLFSVHRASFTEGEFGGKVFWVRNGECSSEAKHTLAGVIDTSLTAFGVYQARQAGREAARTVIEETERRKREPKMNCIGGLKTDDGSDSGAFTYVYSSYMLRALGTLKYIASTEGATTSASNLIVRGDIAGRSFGVFTNSNRNILRCALGSDVYDKLLHSSEASPLGGEGIVGIYKRCKAFYNKVIVPHLLAGENVLVVSHLDVLNVMAYVISKKEVQQFRSFEIDPGKILSSKELCDLMDVESTAAAYAMKRISTMTSMYSGEIIVVSFFVGSAIRAMSNDATVSDDAFVTMLTILFCASTFFRMLDADLASKIRKIPKIILTCTVVVFTLRWIAACVVLWSDRTSVSGASDPTEAKNAALSTRWALFWLLPPSLTTITESRSVGGDYYPAALISTTLSAILPLLMYATLCLLSATKDGTVDLERTHPFLAFVLFGFFVPMLGSQGLCRNAPALATKLRHRWQWIGFLAYAGSACLAGFYVTPRKIRSDIECLFLLENDGDDGDRCAIGTFDPGNVLAPLSVAVFMIIGMRLFGGIVWYVLRSFVSQMDATGPQLTDLYLMLTSPSVLLWTLIALPTSDDDGVRDVDKYALLFGIACCFMCVPIEREIAVETFVKGLLQASVSTMRMPKSEIDDLWNEVKRPNCEYLTRDEISYAVWVICKQTQGWSPGPMKLEILASKLMTVMTKGKVGIGSNRVLYTDFFNYFAWHGKKLDFNTTAKGIRSDEGDDGDHGNAESATPFHAPFNESDVREENSEFNRRWFGRKRKSSLVRHFRIKGLGGGASVAPESPSDAPHDSDEDKREEGVDDDDYDAPIGLLQKVPSAERSPPASRTRKRSTFWMERSDTERTTGFEI